MFKSLSFYNSKGGVGKTTHTVLFASWLAYHEGARVAVVDLEDPHPRIGMERSKEEILLKDKDSWLSRYMAKNPGIPSPYDIIWLMEGEYAPTDEFFALLNDRVRVFVKESVQKYDYVLFDFPAGMGEYSRAFRLLSRGISDLIVIPIDVTTSTRREASATVSLLKPNNQNVVLFWNNVSSDDIRREGYLERAEKVYVEHGLEVLPQRIKTFQKIKKDSDEMLFVKSTVCWPDRYIELTCPELPMLYRELKTRLDAM